MDTGAAPAKKGSKEEPKLKKPWWARLAAYVAGTPRARAWLGYFSAAALAVCLSFGAITVNSPNLTTSGNITWVGMVKMLLLLLWIVLPPIWFWLEYYGIYMYKGQQHDDFDSFKYGQDISAKVWLAAVAALTLLYFAKEIKR